MLIRPDARTKFLMFFGTLMLIVSAIFVYRDGFFSEEKAKIFPVRMTFVSDGRPLEKMPSESELGQRTSLPVVEEVFTVKKGDTCISLTKKGGSPLSASDCELALASFGRSSTTLHIGEIVVLLKEESIKNGGYLHYKRWRFMTEDELRKQK